MVSKEWIEHMSKQDWSEFYADKFMRVERIIPFEQSVLNLPYRFQWVIKKLSHKMVGNVLDIGCSTGILLYHFKHYGWTVAGIDVSDVITMECAKNIPGCVCKTGFADEHIDFPNEHFDVVTCCEVFEHVKDLDKMIDEIFRVLKKGGRLYVTTPIGNCYDCKEHVRYFDFYSLEKVFENKNCDLKICRIFKNGINEKGRYLFAVEVIKK